MSPGLENLKKWAESQGWSFLSEYRKWYFGGVIGVQFIKPDGSISSYHQHKSGFICRENVVGELTEKRARE
ncbi:MAG: hypothetical protein PHG35_02070 [Dehalococcoidales bacterium]|nr:hypothetical protein [Dehalococcoidales bacterium]